MTHSPFPWRLHAQAPTAVFDRDGHRCVNTAGKGIGASDDTAMDNAALIAAIPQMIKALHDIVALQPGSRAAYSKFANAQSIARGALVALTSTDRQANAD